MRDEASKGLHSSGSSIPCIKGFNKILFLSMTGKSGVTGRPPPDLEKRETNVLYSSCHETISGAGLTLSVRQRSLATSRIGSDLGPSLSKIMLHSPSLASGSCRHSLECLLGGARSHGGLLRFHQRPYPWLRSN